MNPADSRMLHSGDRSPEAPISLQAGPLSLLYENGGLRYLKFGEIEVIRRIYAAVRDRNWNTIPGKLRDFRLDQGRDFFHITYESEHSDGDISFVWRAEIDGEPDGRIRFAFDGEARSTFLKNRIGLCVLHPLRECAGRPCVVEYANGEVADAAFPKLVAPEQPVPGIENLAAISHVLLHGKRAEVRFEGDLFEMEDQRNWIDASFKIYSTPLRLPFPVEIQAGTRVRQSVTVRLLGRAKPKSRPESPAVQLALKPRQTFPVPPIGLGISSYLRPYSAQQVQRLKELNLAHLRVDLNASADWTPILNHAITEAVELGLPLEVALTLSPDDKLSTIRSMLKGFGRIQRLVVFSNGAKSTLPETLKLARATFKDLAPIGVGTNADFYQLNQFRPPWQDADFVCWSMNPQVHAVDDASLMETPEAIPAQIASAREYFPGKPLVVSPITLKPRFNAVATGPAAANSNALPPEVDPRQREPIAAAWTLAVLKQLIQSGVDSITCFETVGWRGLMEGDYPSSKPAFFPSQSADVFPVYSVFKALGAFKDGSMVQSTSGDSRRIELLALAKGEKRWFIAQNMTAEPQRIDHVSFVQGMLAAYDTSIVEPPR
jgi:D-apionolactonase